MSDLFGALTKAVEGAGWLAIPAAFVWGILSIVLSPCHLTSVPLVIGYINRGEATSTRRAVWTATCFAGGVLVTLAVAGGIALAAGRLMGQTGIWGNIVVAVVLLVVGLYLLGLLRLPAGLASPTVHPRRDALGALDSWPGDGTGLGALRVCLSGAGARRGVRHVRVQPHPGNRHAAGLRGRAQRGDHAHGRFRRGASPGPLLERALPSRLGHPQSLWGSAYRGWIHDLQDVLGDQGNICARESAWQWQGGREMLRGGQDPRWEEERQGGR